MRNYPYNIFKVIFSLIFFFFYNYIIIFSPAGFADNNFVIFYFNFVRRFFFRPTQLKSSFFTKLLFSKKVNDVFINEIFFDINKPLIITFIIIYVNKKQF